MIAIDITFMSEEMKNGKISSGVGMFCQEILNGIVLLEKQDNFILVTKYEQKEYAIKLFPDFTIISLFNFSNLLFRNKILDKLVNKVENIILPFGMHHFSKSVDWIWHPHVSFVNYKVVGYNSISTIHDLIPVHENKDETSYYKKYLKTIKRSSAVVTISKAVKNDIYRTYRLENKDIVVIPNAVSAPSNFVPVEELLGKKYILDVNAYQPRKNGLTLVKAFEKVVKLYPEYSLVFCGGYDEENTLAILNAEASEKRLNDKIFFYLNIPAEKKNWLIANAAMLVSPTMNEGFGRTPIEAALCKVPVICSDIEALRESTMDLVHFYSNPLDHNNLSNMIVSIIEKPDTMEKLRKTSDILEREYSYKSIAEKYIKLFGSLNAELYK